jgi:hypothetical protein
MIITKKKGNIYWLWLLLNEHFLFTIEQFISIKTSGLIYLSFNQNLLPSSCSISVLRTNKSSLHSTERKQAVDISISLWIVLDLGFIHVNNKISSISVNCRLAEGDRGQIKKRIIWNLSRISIQCYSFLFFFFIYSLAELKNKSCKLLTPRTCFEWNMIIRRISDKRSEIIKFIWLVIISICCYLFVFLFIALWCFLFFSRLSSIIISLKGILTLYICHELFMYLSRVCVFLDHLYSWLYNIYVVKWHFHMFYNSAFFSLDKVNNYLYIYLLYTILIMSLLNFLMLWPCQKIYDYKWVIYGVGHKVFISIWLPPAGEYVLT